MNSRWFVSAAGWSGFAFILSAMLSLGWYVILLKQYSNADSGALLLWISASAVVGLLDFGTSVYINGKIATCRHNNKFRTATRISSFCLSFSFLSFLLYAVVAGQLIKSYNLLPHLGFWQVSSFSILVIGTQVGMTSIAILKGYHKFKIGAICQILNSLFVYGFSIFALLLKNDISVVYFFFAIGSIVSAAISSYFAFRASRLPFDIGRTNRNPYRIYRKLIYLIFNGGLPIFPQQLTGIFFNHILRFLVATLSGIGSVGIISFSFTVATRLHSLCNAFIEILYPLANTFREKNISAKTIEHFFWKKVFPFFILIVLIASYIANLIKSGSFLPTVLFSLGTWLTLAVAPTFHFENAFGRGLKVSILSVMTIPTYSFIFGVIGYMFGYLNWVYGLAYLITQGVFFHQMHVFCSSKQSI